VEDRRTAAERRYDERMEKQQEKIVEKMASKSHRDKVADFNAYLSKLSEHHDIPKVGPG
jgi:protein FAM32A